MPETACLHIQARDADPIRVVTLPGVSVRIGRASHCEVRLPEPEVADEECHLKRRGRTWHLVPVGRPGAVRIDDQPVEQPQPLPFGVLFRVGDHRLILQSTGEASGAWGSFDRPIALDLSANEPTAKPEPPGTAEPGAVPTGAVPHADGSGSDAEDDHLERWKARQEQRESWLRTREQERRWEDRWRAAGERLRSRAASMPVTTVATPSPAEPAPRRRPEPPTPAPAPPTPPLRPDVRARSFARSPEPSQPMPIVAPEVPPAPPPVPVAVVPPPPTQSVRASLSPSGWGKSPIPKRPVPRTTPDEPTRPISPTSPPPPPERAVEPLRDEIISEPEIAVRLAPAPEPVAFRQLSLCGPVSQPAGLGAVLSETAEPSRQGVGPTSVGPEVPPEINLVRLKSDLPQHSSATDADTSNPSSGTAQGEAAEESGAIDPERRASVDPAPPEELISPAVEAPVGFETDSWTQEGPFVADTNLGQAEGWAEAGLFTSATATMEPETEPEPDPPGPEDAPPAKLRSASRRPRRATSRPVTSRSRGPQEPGQGPAPLAAPPPAAPVPSIDAALPDPKLHDPLSRLPTAQQILAARRSPQAAEATVPSAMGRRSGAEPLPTIRQEPAQWSVPLWLGLAPALACALVLGTVGTALAWTWSVEAKNAGLIANRLARGGTKVDPLPDWLTPPDPKWWTTTPGHLTLWALERDRSASDPVAAREARELLSAASQSSPLQAPVRFALARQGQGPGEEVGNPAANELALSRDVVALAWTGQQLLAAGKKEAALRAYRNALEMATRADLSRLGAPSFNDDPQVRRYALPAEDLIGPIVRAMAEHGGWTYAEWSTALPPSGVARLATARALRDRNGPDAETALDAILAPSDTAPAVGSPVVGAVEVAAQAEALALKGRWAEAEQRYREAIDLMPDPRFRRSWWLNLAEIAARQNHESDRQKALEAARGDDPNGEITRRAVELLKENVGRPGAIGARDLTTTRAR